MWAERLELCRVLLKERTLEQHRGSPLRLQGWDVEANLQTNRLIDEALDRYLSSRLDQLENSDLRLLPPCAFHGRLAQVVSRAEPLPRRLYKAASPTIHTDRKATQSPVSFRGKRSPSPRIGLPALTPHKTPLARPSPVNLALAPRMSLPISRRKDLNRSQID
jgi:hypothetical protein